MTEPTRRVSPGSSVDDLCRACKMVRSHKVVVASPEGRALRVRGGEPRGRTPRGESRRSTGGGPAEIPLVTERETGGVTMSVNESEVDLELLLRRVIREESGLTTAAPAEKWVGGDLVLRPGREGLQEKVIPIETFFHKIVMLRNRLRTLEQQLNASDLPDQTKVKVQGYITACYGSLTSFNVLFADDEDRFRGSASD